MRCRPFSGGLFAAASSGVVVISFGPELWVCCGAGGGQKQTSLHPAFVSWAVQHHADGVACWVEQCGESVSGLVCLCREPRWNRGRTRSASLFYDSVCRSHCALGQPRNTRGSHRLSRRREEFGFSVPRREPRPRLQVTIRPCVLRAFAPCVCGVSLADEVPSSPADGWCLSRRSASSSSLSRSLLGNRGIAHPSASLQGLHFHTRRLRKLLGRELMHIQNIWYGDKEAG